MQSPTSIQAPAKYAAYSGRHDLVFNSILHTLLQTNQPIDWQSFTKEDWALWYTMVETEGISPLMFRYVKKKQVKVPPAIQTKLTTAYYDTFAYNTLLYQALDNILPAFSQADISCVALKGAVLATLFYQDIGLRPMSDLDLLVSEKHFPRALEILKQLGFVEKSAPHWMSALLDKGFRYNVTLYGEQKEPIVIELHWRLIAGEYDPRSIDFSQWTIVENHRVSTLQNSLLPSLDVFTHWLFLAAHLTIQHRGETRLLWLYDLYCLSKDHFGDREFWQTLLKRAEELDWVPPCMEAMKQMESSLGVTIPFLAFSVSDQSLMHATYTLQQVETLHDRHVFATWRQLGNVSWSVRLQIIKGYFFPNRAWIQDHYKHLPQQIWLLFYVHRWWMIGKNSLKFIGRHIRKKYFSLSQIIR